MRPRLVSAVALFALAAPLALSAQILRLPRRGNPVPQSPPEPTPAPVARALEYQASRWSGEGYFLVSSFMLPDATGGVTRYATLGTGAHSDYRVTDRFSATADLTLSPFGGPAITTTGEVGGRYRPFSLDQEIRPFVDVRGAFIRMYDSFSAPLEAAGAGAPPPLDYTREGRYSRGVGGITGAGMEYSIARTFSLTTEIAAMRSHMMAYRLTGLANIPSGTSYWMTSVRYLVGFRYNPGRFLH